MPGLTLKIFSPFIIRKEGTFMENLKMNKLSGKNYRLLKRKFALNSELDWLQYPSILRINQPIRKTYKDITEEKLLSKYAPAAVLVGKTGNILYIHGHTGLYLEPAPGYVGSSNVYKMARKEIRRQLRICLQKSINSGLEIESSKIEINFNQKQFPVKLSIVPYLKSTVGQENVNLFLIIFKELHPQSESVTTEGILEKNSEVISSSVTSLEEKKLLEKSHELNRLIEELTLTNGELENSRKKLTSVRNEIASSEAELETKNYKIATTRKELFSQVTELNNIKKEIAEKTDLPKRLEHESESIKSELQKIKDELFNVNSELEDKRIKLEKLNDELNSAPSIFVPEKTETDTVVIEPEVQPEEIKLSEMDYWPIDSEPMALIDDSSEVNYVNEEFGFLTDDSEMPTYSSVPEFTPINDLNLEFDGAENTNDAEETYHYTQNTSEELNSSFYFDDVSNFESTSAHNVEQDESIQSAENFSQDTQNLINPNEDNHHLSFKDVSDFETASAHGFRHDNTIRSVEIPEGVKAIRRSLFYQCTQLEKVIFPSSLEVIEDFAFYGCQKLVEMNLEKCLNLKIIGTSAFEGCSSITALIFQNSLKEIETAAFLGCKSLISISFQESDNLEILGSHVFKSCVSIKLLKLPTNLKQIGISCFYGCTQLESVLLSETLETIGEYAFWACESLKQISCPNKKLLKQPGFTIGFPQGIDII